jgi:hypothetical protein
VVGSVTHREECRLRVFENQVLRRMFELKGGSNCKMEDVAE